MKSARLTSVVVLVLSASACTSVNNHTSTLDAMQNAVGAQAQQPYVEAFIEYGGPSEKWAGPGSLLLHVTAKDEVAEVKTVPEMFAHPVNPASVMETAKRMLASTTGMSRDTARDHLNRLSAAMKDSSSDPAFAGCLSPLKVRLIRGDGALVEKQGCRDAKGWPRIASELVDHFLASVAYQNPQLRPDQLAAPVRHGLGADERRPAMAD